MEIKTGPGQASLDISTCLALMTDKGVPTQIISQNNGLQLKDAISFVPTGHSRKQIKNTYKVHQIMTRKPPCPTTNN